MSNKLDQIVKGAPPPNAQLPDPPSSVSNLPDPTALLPSSPPQIYLNLLILEASLREQYLTLKTRRRQNTLVLFLLSCWIAGHAYILFLPNPYPATPDGTNVTMGTTGYWLMDLWSKLALMSGVVTMILFWGTGQWERGVRWPRRWVGVANRGLRVFNCKMVVLRGPWWRELLGHLSALAPVGSSSSASYTGRSTSAKHEAYHQHTYSTGAARTRDIPIEDEDLSPGGDQIKLLLLSKPFSPDFRQDWETYRAAYWEKENERRAELRRRLKQRQHERAKQQGGFFWWTGWRGWPSWAPAASSEPPKQNYLQPNSSVRRRTSTATRDRAGSLSHSRSSSRSTTPTPDLDDVRSGSRPSSMVFEQMDRRMSTSSATSGLRKRVAGGAPSARSSRVLSSGDSRPSTPTELKK